MPPPQLHREHIKAAIRVKYGSLEAFERAKSLPHHSVTEVLRGRSIRRAAEAIAQELRIEVSTLWPGRLGKAADESNMLDGSTTQQTRHRLSAKVA